MPAKCGKFVTKRPEKYQRNIHELNIKNFPERIKNHSKIFGNI